MVDYNVRIEKLYKELLDSWNRQDAQGIASLFAEDGSIVGFDGSLMNGKMQIESEIKQVFSHHINPAVNAIQSLIAVKDNGMWRISLFQNTPAQFHGRPELTEALTKELQQEVQQ